MKQKKYIAGLYFRLSQEDERQGESASIEHQRTILRKYAEERGFEIYDEYIDDGISGTTFQRPEVQRLLDDAKNRSHKHNYRKRLVAFRKKLHRSRSIYRLRFPRFRDKVYRYSG